MEPISLSSELRRRLQEVLAELNLRMGVFDLKLAEDGEPWWLELNPQGQFLFVEALGGGELLEPFVRFHRNEAEHQTAESFTGSGEGLGSESIRIDPGRTASKASRSE
jgi:hypothetical protein